MKRDTERTGNLSGDNPPYLHPAYESTRLRAPKEPLVIASKTLEDVRMPAYGRGRIGELDHDLTRQHDGEPLGERVIVTGRVTDEDNRPIRDSLIEIWQANAAGRYVHEKDAHPAPLDPNFTGAGRTMTDANGEYRFVTVKPGAYPWKNHHNAWRPAHIHLSLFGEKFKSRLITQMYFPGDPLFEFDPILTSINDEKARNRLVSHLDMEVTEPEWALGYRFDITLGGGNATPVEHH